MPKMHNLPLSQKSFEKLKNKGISHALLENELGDVDYFLELFHAQGVEIAKRGQNYYFTTKFIPIEQATFCIVDIETNGSKIQKHQIIEIAAVKVKNSKIIDTFETLIKCESINEHITEITGICAEDTKNSPDLKSVMHDFKAFLGDAIFVAHDVKFDYKFISDSLEKVGLLPLSNRTLCSIDLAERTIESYRYGLKYLNEYLGLNPNATHHRAMSDVMTTYELFIRSLQKLPDEVKTVEDLIEFSKSAPRLKRPKFDPLLGEQKGD